ncbi:TetR/AcrR family transcriptional regulator [Sediminicola luteus]|nr:TetR/AcrR family transcriptional regulator [Sediminicola luteus]
MPRVKQFRKEDVLDKAISLFWKQGFHATSVQELVTHLGINRASLYNTFGDKEQLFIQALDRYREKNLARIRTILFSHGDIRKGFKSFFERTLKSALSHSEAKGCFIVNSSTELLPGNEAMQSFFQRNKSDFEALFLEYLEKGEAEGQFGSGKDLTALAALLFTLQNGIQVVGKVTEDEAALMQNVHTTLDLLD